jgi:hypothetical protein
VRGHRLGDMHPQVLARDGELIFFWCRWTTERPVPVALPLAASDDERWLLRRALEAWEAASLGIRFVILEGGPAAITLEVVDGPVESPAGPDAGNTVADCRVDETVRSPGDRLLAELASARIRLARRSAPDWRGTERPLTSAEFLGVALHELGHALGYSGHARRGDTIMVREVDAIRRAGAALLAGEPFRDPTLAALYRHPSGWIARRTEVAPWRTDLVDRMRALAAEHRLDGPFVRSGETRARIFWKTSRGGDYGLVLVNLRETLRHPDRALIAPEARTRAALPPARDLRPD